jgi:8-oxo-dGTP diphosphatase
LHKTYFSNESMQEEVHNFYGNRLRIRVCGILLEGDSMLLANHRGLGTTHFWAPPGGGMEFGESATECLVREWKEETGLDIKVSDFLFACEFIKSPLHALELFFLVKKLGGTMALGIDMEKHAPQILSDLRFMDWQTIAKVDKSQLHGMFQLVGKPAEIVHLKGYFKL